MRKLPFLLAASVLLVACGSKSSSFVGLDVRPVEFSAPEWDDALGGEGAFDPARLEGRSDLPDAAEALAVARAVALADLEGSGREAYEAYFSGTPSGACADVAVLAASAYSMGAANGTRYAKALVAWSGACAVPVASPAIIEVFLEHAGQRWEPVHAGTIPQRPESPSHADVPQWALEGLTCAQGAQARIEVAMAWRAMCEQAAKDGVTLQAVDGWRSTAAQERRFAEAVEYYGSQEEARRHVAPVEGSCASRHCAGEAVDVRMDPAASAWLRAVVACRRVDGSVIPASSCRADERAVLQMERYGFSEPLATASGHLEYTVALPSLQASACADSPSAQIPVLVMEVFRCVTRALGPVREDVLREALVVSECSSAWNPSARQFDGKYARTPHPATSRVYDGEGLFGLPARTVAQLVAGGAATDPWQNATAAARLYVREVQRGRNGWGFNVCATGDAAVTAVLGTPWPAWMNMWVK